VNQSDYMRFVTIWSACHDVYGRSPSEGAIDISFQALARFDIQDISLALTAHMNDPEGGRFAPKPADIVRQIEGGSESRALSAWSKVERAIGAAGPWASVAFDDAIIHAVLEEMGGWPKVCEVTEKELPFMRNEFAKRYQGFITRPPESYQPKMLGLQEQHNGEAGSLLKLIGNIEKAQAVMAGGSDIRRIECREVSAVAGGIKLLGGGQ
jgi:hypothetical protein